MTNKSTNANATNDVDDLRAEFQSLRDDVAQIAETLVGMGRGKIRAAREKAAEAKDEGLDRLRALVDDLRERGEETRDWVRDEVQTHPAVSLAAVFGLGFLIGKLTSRS